MNDLNILEKTMRLPGYTLVMRHFDVLTKTIPLHAKVSILGGHTALSLTNGDLLRALSTHNTSIFWTGGECNQSNFDRLVNESFIQTSDWIIGVGGGRALDLAKWVANALDKPIICIPTIASTCAACSSVSVIYDESHQFTRVQVLSKAPEHIIINAQILVKAPASYLHAGIGDAISKPIEIAFSGKGRAWTYANLMGKAIAEGSLQILLDQGDAAYRANLNQTVNPAFLNVICAVVMGIGHASILVEEDYNSALAHALYNAFMRIDALKLLPHGVIVAYGVLIQCLVDEDMQRFDQLYRFYRALNLPTSLHDISFSIEHPELAMVIDQALLMPDCKLMPIQLTQSEVFRAMQTLESINHKRCELAI